MLKTSMLATLFAALAIFAASCGGGKENTPQQAMEALKEAFASQDLTKLEACYTADAWKSHGESMTKEFKKLKEDGMTVAMTWAESDITMSGDTATVKAKLKFKTKDGKEEDESETIHLKKTAEAGWKCSR